MTETLIIVVVFLIWYLVGFASAIYGLAKDRDVDTNDLPALLALGLGGLFTLIVVLPDLINIKWKIKNTVILKKRK